MNANDLEKEVELARERWLQASEYATKLAQDMYQPGSGYGAPEAEVEDRYKVEVARNDAQRLMQEYHDLDRRLTALRIGKLQKSQTLATWASFTVAFVVGVTSIVGTILQILSKSA